MPLTHSPVPKGWMDKLRRVGGAGGGITHLSLWSRCYTLPRLFPQNGLKIAVNSFCVFVISAFKKNNWIISCWGKHLVNTMCVMTF